MIRAVSDALKPRGHEKFKGSSLAGSQKRPAIEEHLMSRESTLKRIVEGGIVAVVRSETSEPLVKVVEALALGGVTAAEVTFTVPDAIDVIREVRRQVGDAFVLGAGTVLDSETARAAILAGAEYIVSPIVNLDVIRLCRRYDKVVMPGALTPTEVVAHGKRVPTWSRFSRPMSEVLRT